jgi:polyisoprenoid-binding protein YceI
MRFSARHAREKKRTMLDATGPRASCSPSCREAWSRPLRLLPLFALALAATGCGAGVQRATVTAAPANAPSAPAASVKGAPLESEGGRFIARAATSKLEVKATAVMVGEQTLRFERWRALVLTGRELRVDVDVDATSLRSDLSIVERIAKNQLMEVHLFPHATFTGTLKPRGAIAAIGDRDVDVDVDVMASIHGVTRRLTFKGKVRRAGKAYRFSAEFKVPRQAFDIRLHSSWDSFIDDDVLIELDVRAEPEPVTAQPVDAGGGSPL